MSDGFPSQVVQIKPKKRKGKKKKQVKYNDDNQPWYVQSKKSKKQASRRQALAETYNGGTSKRAKSWVSRTRLAPTPPPDDAYSVE